MVCILCGAETAFFYRFNYIFLYLAVFLYSDRLVKAFSKENRIYIFTMTGILFITLAARIFIGCIATSHMMEIFYTSVVAQVFGYVMALWVCGFVFMLGKFINSHVRLQKVIGILDKSSYEMYITHGVCISTIAGCFQNGMVWVLLGTVIVFTAAILAAILLHTISDPLYRKSVVLITGYKK